MDINAEKKYFLEALCLFYETQWLHNVRVTEILTKGSLDALPKEWLQHLQLLKNDELNELVAKKTIKLEWPNTLKAFVEKCKRINRLSPSTVLPSVELTENFKIGLSQRKQHEIIHLAHLVHTQCKSYGIQMIIDLGAGLGYVCQLLHSLYGYHVLGLEKSKENVNRACARQKKFYPNSLTKVKYIHCEVTHDSANIIRSILQQEFSDATHACLIGLHACGDLSINASKIFHEMNHIKLLILISCCYHKLSISKSVQSPPLQEKQYFDSFPVSNCLQEMIATYGFDIGQFLRVPFLRLACQESADKWHDMSKEKHDEHSFHVLARAVLELYAQQNNFTLKKKFRKATRKSQCSNFSTYIRDSLTRYDILRNTDTNLTDNMIMINDKLEEEITEMWEKQNKKYMNIVEIYTGLQMMLQLPAESLILQDRLCWLREQGFEALAISVTNNCLSPRSYAIVSYKN